MMFWFLVISRLILYVKTPKGGPLVVHFNYFTLRIVIFHHDQSVLEALNMAEQCMGSPSDFTK